MMDMGSNSAASFWGRGHPSWSASGHSSTGAGHGPTGAATGGSAGAGSGNHTDPKMAEKLMTELQVRKE